MTDEATWQRLCELIDPDPEVASAVTQALEAGDDPWEALLDGLDDAGVLAYLHSDDTGMELTDALAQLPRIFALQPDLDDVTDTDDLGAASALADRLLAEEELRLARLVEDDDSWPLVVVPTDSVDELVRLVRSTGHEVVIGTA